MAAATFRDLFWELAYAAGHNPDATAGTVTLINPHRRAILQFLTEALREVWYPLNPQFAWPETIEGAVFDVTDGKVARSLLGEGNYWSVWTTDPRIGYDPFAPHLIQELKVHTEWDGAYLYPATTAATVFIFYRKTRPKWTTTLVNTEATYNPSTESAGSSALAAAFNLNVSYFHFITMTGTLTVRANGGTPVVFTLAASDPANGTVWINSLVYGLTHTQLANRLETLLAAAFAGVLTVTNSGTGTLLLSTITTGAAATLTITSTISSLNTTIVPANVTGQDAVAPGDPVGTVLNTLVFDELGTGHVYMATNLDAPGNDLTNTAKWIPQPLPERLVPLIMLHAESLRLRAKGMYKEAQLLKADALAALENDVDRVFFNSGLAPWFKMFTHA